MFKSIQKGGRIAAVAIGLVAALAPLATPPAALADGVPTPELEKSYTFNCEGSFSYVMFLPHDNDHAILINQNSDYEITGYSALDLTDGTASNVPIPDDSVGLSGATRYSNSVSWLSGNTLVVYSVEDRSSTLHPISPKNYPKCFISTIDSCDVALITYKDSNLDPKETDVYDLKTDKLLYSYTRDKAYKGLITSRDGKYLYILLSDSGTSELKRIDISNGNIEHRSIPGKSPNVIWRPVDSDTVYLYSTTDNGYVYRVMQNGNVKPLSKDKNPCSIRWGNKHLVIRKSGSAEAKVFESDSGNPIGSVKIGKNGYAVSVSDDGRYLLSEKGNSDLQLFDLKSNSVSTVTVADGTQCIYWFSNDGQKIFRSYRDADNSNKLHFDIYKSNIPHSVIDDIAYFAQNNLSIVIGGGIVLVLVVGGIVIVCVRRKRRSASTDDTSIAPSGTKKHRRRKKGAHQQDDAPHSPTVPVGTAQQQPMIEPAAVTSRQPLTEAVPVVHQQSGASATPRFCRHCGNPLIPGSKFCPKCGQPTE